MLPLWTLSDALGGSPCGFRLMREVRGKLSVPGRSCDVLGRFRVLGFLLLEGSSPHPQLAGTHAARFRSHYSATMTGVLGHQARQKTRGVFGVRGYALTGSRGIP